ncbi:MAG: ribonuclease H-like domain-containing protein [Candidatus Paceibacterota bacterium]
MNYVVFDIETKNIFQDVGKRDPALLDISLIGIYDSASGEYSSYLEDEFDDLWPILEKADALVGFNSDHFDIPLLNKYYHGELERVKSIDLMKTIFNTLGRRISLDAVAQATLGIQKSAHGLQATTWWKQGEIEKVRKYCLQDVKVTKELYEHIRKEKAVKYKDRGELKTVKLDISDWDERDAGSMTKSLPF